MSKNTIICADCRYCRKSGATPIACLSIGNIQLAGLYGKCRRFEPRKTKPSNNPQKSLFDE